MSIFDDFRKQADETSFFEESDQPEYELEVRTEKLFLGMTAVQRFVVAFMLFLIVVLIGVFALLVFEKVIPPFLG